MIEHIGRNIRRIRRDRDLTQQQLARFVRISQQQLSALENGARLSNLNLIPRFARILGVHPDELLRGPEVRAGGGEEQAGVSA